MTLSNCRATFGLNAKVTPQKAGSNGTLQVGDNNETLNLTQATKIISFDAVIVGSGSDLVIDVSALDAGGSTTAWTPGSPQKETATAVGSITAAGNASVVVTAAGMAGSPKTIAVAVALNDTAATWAGKVRAALAADISVDSRFSVSGSSTSIILTRKPTSTHIVNGTAINVYPSNDATLNISLDNGTCTGITTAATSSNGAGADAGVATAGAYCPDLDSTDFEGNPTGGASYLYAYYIKTVAGNALITQSTFLTDLLIGPGDFLQMGRGYVPFNDIVIEPAVTGDEACHVTITLAGS